MWIGLFDTPHTGDLEAEKVLFGGKGAGLRALTRMGVPTPPGFILTTELCTHFYRHKKTLPADFSEQLTQALHTIENQLNLKLGDAHAPLLLSVRSGARASMPGMMDTVLNLGLNSVTVEALARKTQDGRFAYDSYRRFIQMYSNVVLGMSLAPFEDILSQYKMVRNVKEDSNLEEEDLRTISERYKDYVRNITGQPFPEDVHAQLRAAIQAVFRSWMNKRAVTYRQLYHIPETWGTAVVIQAMVFGNLGMDSATGVAFTRNPATGQKAFFGEYLLRAQGEDVVAGIRTPQPLCSTQKTTPQQKALEEVMPEVYQELVTTKDTLEQQFKDMQDIEFTVQKGKLWILQTRKGKRTAAASVKIAVDMVGEHLIPQEEALARFDPLTLDQLLHPTLRAQQNLKLLGTGLPASPGAAIGRIAFSAEACLRLAAQGEKVILVRDETSPEDIQGMAQAQGVLTATGGMTSHAAVVARGMGKPCVVGTQDLFLHPEGEALSLGGVRLQSGDVITLDGASGQIFQGKGKLEPPQASQDFTTFMSWADTNRRLRVRANADTPKDVQKALDMGAEGVGLCRTEHMFFAQGRILAVREMILAANPGARKKALAKILPLQKQDFIDILKTLQGAPFTVRLLDPPLHEFLPQSDAEIDELSSALRITNASVRSRIAELSETNPMLGNRGCRLGITVPEIYDTQIQALVEAAAEVISTTPVHLEIMIPLISITGEFTYLRQRIQRKIAATQERLGQKIPWSLGTMIELPRAALKADKIAQNADFLSFGTNDLTQTTFGFSRDDVSSFLGKYRNKGILERDPFASLDQSGVGELIKIAVHKARSANPTIKLGVCGEQGGEPLSIGFFEKLGIDYVSCSPFRVPIARLAAAQASLKNREPST